MVFEKLKGIISEQLEIAEEEITMESNIIDDFDADSLDLVDIVMSVEDEFDVEVPEDAVEKMKTVGDVVKFIEENI
ncbi:MAG: acyl carrier protein [Oscillospiraceae bacterium]|nr:acyl carrier protein [Oscillospiraceae bacterium]MBP1552659.1 acyl carrier protein [Oscillospiraceae bacterium]MBP1570279.1 acyl carrier protein [Oscillospiraceae bacterium]MBQ5313332.1 acyl carrier protein [Oscillospiraceae bacterium]MBQ5323962.1 acyl carrier protein [Oscillospiraceae bacterium]